MPTPHRSLHPRNAVRPIFGFWSQWTLDVLGGYPSLHAEHWIDAETGLSLGYGKRRSRSDPESLKPLVDH